MAARKGVGQESYERANGGNKSPSRKFVSDELNCLSEEEMMGFFGRYFPSLFGKKEQPEKRSGDMRKATGAGPALAAHSKDAKSVAATGQNPAAARKKSDR
jgi:hypothetical protein